MGHKNIHIRRLYRLAIESWVRRHCVFLVKYRYGDIWHLRDICAKTNDSRCLQLYHAYMDYYGAAISYEAQMEDIPTFPHGIIGVFISRYAHIGKNCIIFQHVTIGSNTLKESGSRLGGGKIEDGVMIGAGAKIIGAVTIGRNARIGAGCVVVKDVPVNATVVSAPNRVINHEFELDNTYTGSIE